MPAQVGCTSIAAIDPYRCLRLHPWIGVSDLLEPVAWKFPERSCRLTIDQASGKPPHPGSATTGAAHGLRTGLTASWLRPQLISPLCLRT